MTPKDRSLPEVMLRAGLPGTFCGHHIAAVQSEVATEALQRVSAPVPPLLFSLAMLFALLVHSPRLVPAGDGQHWYHLGKQHPP